MNGYGERTGNCNLTSVIPCLVLKMGIECIPKENVRHLRELSLFIDDLANVRHDIRQPFVGATAFAHKGGIHVNAVEKVARSYEHIEPEAVGNRRRVLVSELSGRSNVLIKAHELGVHLPKDSAEVREILAATQTTRTRGLRIRGRRRQFPHPRAEAAQAPQAVLQPARLPRHHGSSRRRRRIASSKRASNLKSTARSSHTVAEGDGPVNALDKALRAALTKFYPSIAAVQLVDYKVRILDSQTGTAAKTRVMIESTDGTDIWGTVGVNDNIIEASWEALVDSVEYKLFKDEQRKP